MLRRSFYFLISFLIIYSCASDIPLATTGNISGTVKEQGSSNAISGVNIALSGESTQSTISGTSGTFSFNNIPVGNYVLTASKGGYVEDARPTTVNPEKTSSVTFTLQKKLPTANPNSLELTFDKKEETIELKNNQADVLNFTTSTSKTWLTVSPSTGSIQSNNALIITVKADFTTLSPGTYDETLVINVEGSTLSIPIKVTYTQPPYITVTKPSEDDVYKMGETLSINWDSNLNGKVKIELLRASSVQLTIETETENKEGGSYDWFIPAMESEYYKIKVTSKENPDVDFTTEPFKIDKGLTKPVVTTAESPKETGINFIKIEGTIVSLGVLSDKVDQYGHVYSINNETPTVADNRTKYGESTETKTYTSDLTSLQSAETYYIRAYATNAKGTSYGDVVTATTVAGGPIVSTSDITDITQTSAKSGGNISSDGGSTITERGLFYGTTEELNADSSKVKDSGTSTGEFTSSITGLTKGTKYYVMAYGKNSSGYGYGDIKSFNTVGDPPTVETSSVDKISGTKAEVHGKVTSNGGEPLSSYGFAYGKSSSPTIENNKWEIGTTDFNGDFKGLISGLETSTKYYVRAYATNARGTSYGENKDFTTTNGLPGVSTVSSESVNGNSAVINGKIDDNGGSTLTSYGFAYAESPNPTIDGFKIEVGTDGEGEYNGKITDLKPSTKYYVKAYATNANGTSYGDQIDFTTTDGLPKVNTVGSRDIVGTKATLTGTIVDNGGQSLTSYGFVYSKTQNPTLENSKITVGEDSTGGYSGQVTGLETLTKYYYRAYATNPAGTAYGSELNLTTLDGLPQVQTTEIKDITSENAKLVGKILSDGGENIKEYGFVYSTEQSPTIENNKVVVEENTDYVFETIINGLTRLTKYYVRAFVTNDAGTAYGDELNFSTVDGPYFTITAPTLNQNLSTGSSFNITWDTNKSDDTVTIEHWVGDIKTELSNDTAIDAKSFTWNIAEDTTTGPENIIKIIENDNAENIYESPNFNISSLTYVPDDVFEKILIYFGYDDVEDDYVKTANISDVTQLDAGYPGIGSVFIEDPTGIEDFKALTFLNWDGVKVSSLDLSSLESLEKIIVKSAFLTSNQEYITPTLTSIILPESDALKELNLDNNALNAIDISGYSNLEIFSFGLNSGISNDFRSSMPTNIDITSNQKLIELRLDGANFESLNFSGITTMKEVSLSNNNLTSLDVSEISDLEYINVQGNSDLVCIKATQDQISQLSITKSDYQIFSPDCTKTYVPDDNFEQALIDLGYDSVLDDYVLKANIMGILNLDLTNKEISDIEGIQDFIGLLTLKAGYNNFKSINLYNLNNLNSLEIVANVDLESIVLPNNSENIETIKLNSSHSLESVDVSSYSNLKELNLNEAYKITTLDISNNLNLEKLYIAGTKIRNIDISKIDEDLDEFYFYADLNSEESYLQCVRVSKSFLNNFRENTTEYPDSWTNNAGLWSSLKNNAAGDIARYMCYEDYIKFDDEFFTGGQIMFNSNGDLYLSAKINDAGLLYKYTSQTDKTVVAGNNGAGTDLNQLRTNFKFDFDSENNIITIDGFHSGSQSSDLPVRILKWTEGQSNANLIVSIDQSNLNSQGSYPERIDDVANIIVDNDDNIFFESSQNVFQIKSGTTSLTKILEYEDFNKSNFSRISNRGFKWFKGGLDIFDNKIFTMPLYSSGNDYNYLLTIDKSNNNELGQYTYHSYPGNNFGNDSQIRLIKGTEKYFLAVGSYNTYIANKLDSSGNGWIKLNGYNMQFTTSQRPDMNNFHFGPSKESVAIKDGYIYIATYRKIMKSIYSLE